MTTINVTALTAAGVPVPGLPAIARLAAVPGHLPAGEIVARAGDVTDDAGVASFTLSPTTGTQHYVITCGAGRWLITVPASGTFAVGDPTIAYGDDVDPDGESGGTDDGEF